MVKEGKGRVPLGAHREGLRVARHLAKKIEAAGLSVRRVEEMVGWGQKTLQQILNGEQPIRVSHVAAVLETLELDLGEFYRELAGPDGEEVPKESQGIAEAKPRRKTGTEEEPLKESQDYQLVEALLERCRSLRFSDPEGMILAASLAVVLAERMSASQHGPEKLADLQARAWAELGNAHRVADDLAISEAALARALQLSSRGTADPLLLAQLMDLTASLYTDQRRFGEAHRLLDWVYAIYRHLGDNHLAARALISKGISVVLAAETEEGLNLLQQGILLADVTRDPKLILAGVHALLVGLVDCGRVTEAGALFEVSRDLYRALYSLQGERLAALRARWLEGRIAWGLGQDHDAEKALLQVREGLQEVGLPVTAAVASLDLAAVWLRQGRTAEIKGLIDEVIAIFRAQSIQREPITALLMLKEALRKNQATAALLRTVATELRRLERLPRPKTSLPT